VQPGQSLLVALQSALEEALGSLPIPKVMNYQLEDGTTTVQFVRPARRLVAIRGHEVLPVTALGLTAGTTTHGHRFMAPGDLPVHSADSYAEQLEEEGLIVASFAQRRARIAELVEAAAASFDATPIMPDELLDEVTALVEWPVVYDSGFEEEFLEVPPECLILTMQQNQKYFALRDRMGRLMNRFLLVSHIEATDGGVAIRSGNARVVRARLADAKFFFDQDRKETLESRIPGLAHVVYHNKLGSQLERVERITGLAVALAKELGVDRTHVERAARLAKADLRTLMVGEFPELQGIMGEYYARHDGETTDVAMAIREHYQPRFAGDALPTSKVGLCAALADKLETLVGLFGIGEKPTGERDPFGLRRHALGVLRMLMEKSLPLPLPRMLALAQSEFTGVKGFKPADAELAEFLYDRLRGLLRDAGYTANEVEAVVAQAPARIDLVPSQLAAVRAFMELPEAESLAAANKRIGNILKKADDVAAAFDAALLMEPAERALGDAFAGVQPSAERLYASGDYAGMLKALAPLKLPVDRFFDEVMVNVDDATLRANRLGLLSALRATMNRVADISKLTA
jgi:glycyl-tRNA synthetase beta chain